MRSAYDKYLQQEAAEWSEAWDEATTDGYLAELEESEAESDASPKHNELD